MRRLRAQKREVAMGTVKDIMTSTVTTIPADASPRDAAWSLTLKGLSGAPVQDEHGNVVGVLSKSDLTDPRKFHVEPRCPPVASDLMTPVLFAARETDSVRFAVRRMVETGSHRLIVVGDDGALVGIVTPMDVLRGLLDRKIDVQDFA